MNSVPLFSIIVVTLAASLYIYNTIDDMIKSRLKSKLQIYSDALKALHASTYEEIRTSFDFWWSGEPSRIVRAAVLKENPIPEEAMEAMPEGMVNMFIAPAVDTYRDAALHLAVHVRMTAKEQELLSHLPKLLGVHEIASDVFKEHQDELKDERAELVKVGVNVEEIDSKFCL